MIGDTLRFLREKTNKTQEETAKALGIKRSTYSHFENNRNNPDNETLVKMANYFNVSTDYLLGRDPKEDDLKTADKNVQLIAAHIDDGTTPEEMNDILTYIDFIKSKREKK
nr:helix-turn-helix transcriptional regulator [Limosilactobacillus mucosae]